VCGETAVKPGVEGADTLVFSPIFSECHLAVVL